MNKHYYYYYWVLTLLPFWALPNFYKILDQNPDFFKLSAWSSDFYQSKLGTKMSGFLMNPDFRCLVFRFLLYIQTFRPVKYVSKTKIGSLTKLVEIIASEKKIVGNKLF